MLYKAYNLQAFVKRIKHAVLDRVMEAYQRTDAAGVLV